MVSSLDSVVRRPRTWVCWEVGWKVHAIRSKIGWEDYVTTSHHIHPNHGQHASHPHPRIPTSFCPACSCIGAPLSHPHVCIPPHPHCICAHLHFPTQICLVPPHGFPPLHDCHTFPSHLHGHMPTRTDTCPLAQTHGFPLAWTHGCTLART